MASSHWIGSIAFELRSGEQEALDPVRRAIRENYETLVARPLGAALDRAEASVGIERHRRIEVDLGAFSPDEFGAALARHITEAIPRSAVSGGHAWRRERQNDDAGLLLSFLEHGTFAWPSPGKALDAITQALVSREDAYLERFAGRLVLLFSSKPSAALRFARQCPARLVLAIVAILGRLKFGRRRLTQVSARHLGEADAPRLAAALVQLARQHGLPDAERRWLAKLVSGADELSPIHNANEARVSGPDRSDPFGARSDEPLAARLIPLPKAANSATEGAAVAETLPLEAAGLVILHPFIVPLFAACELLSEEGEFRGEKERARAVLLLHFSVTGEAEVPEPELALAKLLCGIEIAESVPRQLEPTALERSECDAMLASAIRHWGALGESSSEALRETFLKRPGQLRKKGEDWRLAVEQRGVDVLLDRLPWAISLVKTRFMARPLRVEWR